MVSRGTKKKEPIVVTQRNILGLVSSLFDPLGIVAPFTVRSRLILKNIWQTKGQQWDDPVNEEEKEAFLEWFRELRKVSDIVVPRCYFERKDTPSELQLHIFADASLNAMCASAYIRAKFLDNSSEVVFVVGKARVAPMKQLTVPKLELQSAIIACRLLDLIKKEHDWNFDRIFLWSDSTTVLQWIRSSHKKHPVFVANRLGEILESTSVDQWRYVPTDQNPADCGTRGLTVEELEKSRWIAGPKFLQENENA